MKRAGEISWHHIYRTLIYGCVFLKVLVDFEDKWTEEQVSRRTGKSTPKLTCIMKVDSQPMTDLAKLKCRAIPKITLIIEAGLTMLKRLPCSLLPAVNPSQWRVVVNCGQVDRALDLRSRGLGFDSQCWPCVEVQGKLSIPHCLCPPSRTGYLVH